MGRFLVAHGKIGSNRFIENDDIIFSYLNKIS